MLIYALVVLVLLLLILLSRLLQYSVPSLSTCSCRNVPLLR